MCIVVDYIADPVEALRQLGQDILNAENYLHPIPNWSGSGNGKSMSIVRIEAGITYISGVAAITNDLAYQRMLYRHVQHLRDELERLQQPASLIERLVAAGKE